MRAPENLYVLFHTRACLYRDRGRGSAIPSWRLRQDASTVREKLCHKLGKPLRCRVIRYSAALPPGVGLED